MFGLDGAVFYSRTDVVQTGLDPKNGAKLRAVQGVDAASSFIQGLFTTLSGVPWLTFRRILDLGQDHRKLGWYDPRPAC